MSDDFVQAENEMKGQIRAFKDVLKKPHPLLDPEHIQHILAKPFLMTIHEAGYTLDTVPIEGICFRAGSAFDAFGSFYGIPIVIDKDVPSVSIVLAMSNE